MILTRDYHHGQYEIRSYEPGTIKINDQLYHNSVLVSTEQLLPWRPETLAELVAADFELIASLQPEVVLLGTGSALIFPDKKLLAELTNYPFGVEIMSTIAACRTFNVLMSESRHAIAALLIR